MQVSADAPDDVFGELLAALEFTSQLYFRTEHASAFALEVPAQPGVIRFHVATTGECRVGMPGRAPLDLGTGDLVLVPHGAAHVVSGEAIPERPTALVCGHFAFGPEAPTAFAGSLPALLHVPAEADIGWAWIEAVVAHIEREARARRPGHEAVTLRLTEILCIELLRAYATHGDLAALSALADPQLGRALRAMHADPAAPWSLGRLARTAGLSRTLFAERFRARLGTSPMRYLAAARMQKARDLLARGGCSVGEAARRVGYASESAFHRAFREQFGAPPGAWRRQPGSTDAPADARA